MSACDGNGPRIGTSQPLDRVVLVPCSASSARQWKPLAEELAGFRNVPLNLWGHGNQGRWRGAGPLSLAQEAMAIHAACPDGPPFHLVGHSYGERSRARPWASALAKSRSSTWLPGHANRSNP